jgi:PAS domain S-box-containing protein
MHSLTASLEGLLDAVPDVLVGVDREGMIRLVNRQTGLQFGYAPDDLIGLPVEVLVPESLRAIRRVHRDSYNAHPRTPSMGLGLRLNRRRREGTQFPTDVRLFHLDTQDGLLVIAAVRDLTDRKRATEKRDQMSRLLAVIEFSRDAVISTTLEGAVTSWNPAAERLLGYKSAEIIGRSGRLLSRPDRTGEADAILAKIKDGQAVQNFETVRVRKDRTAFPVSLTVSPIYDEHGAIIGASAMPRDMTRARHGFDAAGSMIESSLYSPTEISPEHKITGVPRDTLIGTDFSDYFTEPAKADRIYQLVFSEGMAVDYPLTMRHKDGTLTEVLYNASVYRDAGGNVLAVFAAARDVTRQMQAQREVAEQQAREHVRLAELERFQKMTIERALKVIEWKQEIESLKGSGGTQRGDFDDKW